MTYWTITRNGKQIGKFTTRGAAEAMAHATYGRDWRSLCAITVLVD